MNNAQKIGKNMRRIREEKGMTMRVVAEASGLCESAVSQYENGHREPRSRNLEDIAAALGCSVVELLPSSYVEPEPVESSV